MAEQFVTVTWSQEGQTRTGTIRIPDGKDPKEYVEILTDFANMRMPAAMGHLTVRKIEPKE